jgi:hypothetical protein
MGNTASIKNHAKSSEADKKAATKAIIKKLKKVIELFVDVYIVISNTNIYL